MAVSRLLKGAGFGGKTFKVHLDGYNQLPYLTGQQPKSNRTDFAYFNDDGVLVAYRHGDWKAVFCQMEKPGGFPVWYSPFTCLRIPKLFNLRMDPYERADITSNTYYDWILDNAYVALAGTTVAAQFLETFKEFPPVQKPNTFTVNDAGARLNVPPELFEVRLTVIVAEP